MRFLRLRVSIFGGDKIVEANFWSLGSDFFGELFARLCVYYRRRDNKIKISKTSNYWNYSFFMKRKIKYILKIRLINLRLFSWTFLFVWKEAPEGISKEVWPVFSYQSFNISGGPSWRIVNPWSAPLVAINHYSRIWIYYNRVWKNGVEYNILSKGYALSCNLEKRYGE